MENFSFQNPAHGRVEGGIYDGILVRILPRNYLDSISAAEVAILRCFRHAYPCHAFAGRRTGDFEGWDVDCNLVASNRSRLLRKNTALEQEGDVMLRYAVIFFIIAIIAAVFGFGGLAGTASGIAVILFFAFLMLGVLSLLFGRRSTV